MTDFIERPASNFSISRRRLVLGIGNNDSWYMVSGRDELNRRTKCPYYAAWKHMLERCYCKHFQLRSPTYKDCYVVKEWLVFSCFRKWMARQNWQGMSLDKDLKIIGNKVYGPSTCLFIPQHINTLLSSGSKIKGAYPIGATYYQPLDKFLSCCSVNGRKKYLGYFDTPELAHSTYKSFKKKLIEDIASLPENEHIREHLLNHADLLG